MYFPSKNKAISNSPNSITKNTVVFLYVLFSLVSSLLFSLSIGLNVIRLTDAITVAIANFKSHCTCIDNIMHRNNRKPDPRIQVCKFFECYPPLNFLRTTNGKIRATPCFTLPKPKPITPARISGDANRKKLYNAYL